MKKYFILLLLSFVLFSCNNRETQPISSEVPKNTQQELSKNEKNIVVENNSISNTGEIIEAKNEEIVENKNIEYKKVENIFETQLDSVIASISWSLLDKNTFDDFINDDSWSIIVWKINDWINAFQTPCSSKNTNFPIYNSFVYNYWLEETPVLELERYCSNSKSYNEWAKKMFNYITGKNNYTLHDFDFNTSSLNSNTVWSSPDSPIEKLIATQIFYWFEIEKFISVVLYKNQIIIIFWSSQEPWLPYYKLLRVYSKDNHLYVKTTSLDIESILNVNYWNNFWSDLYQKSFQIDYWDTRKICNIFSKKENELLQWDWISTPSIINEKINNTLIQELSKIIE